MRLGIHTCFWKRFDLARIFIDYWSAMELPGVEIVYAAAYSYDGHPWKDVLGEAGWRSVEAPNLPIGRKLNRALPLLDDCDVVMAVGSDDFASRGWVRYALSRMEHTEMLGLRSCYMYSPELGELRYILGTPVGAGRTLRRSLLERTGWALWDYGRNRALDASVVNNIQFASGGDWQAFEWVNDIRRQNAMMVGVKVGDPDQKNENIWGYQEVLSVHGWNYVADPAMLDHSLGVETMDRIRALR